MNLAAINLPHLEGPQARASDYRLSANDNIVQRDRKRLRPIAGTDAGAATKFQGASAGEGCGARHAGSERNYLYVSRA